MSEQQLPLLVDSHCHLNYPDFAEDFDEVLRRAKDNGVQFMQTICTKVAEFDQVRSIAEAHDFIFCSVGVHPHEVESEPDVTVEQLIEYTKHPKVIGLGETGLDYYYEHSPRVLQQESFLRHIRASQETGVPLIIHTRDADEDTVEILETEMEKKPFKGLIHCFSSSSYLADKALELGFYISLSGILTFKGAGEVREAVKSVPLERLLVETDAPYLAPVPKRGKRNEPAFTRYTAEYLAELRQVPYKQVADVTTANFFDLFGKARSGL